MSNSEIKYLKKEKWYHGTTLHGLKEICRIGIKADYNEGNELDFGYGFYLTPIKKQAEQFILKLLEFKDDMSLDFIEDDENNLKDLKTPVVLEFNLVPLEWYESNKYNFKILNNYDDEFAEFVFKNRIYNLHGENQHNYDFIFGVMSDSLPTLLIQKYKNSEIDKETVIEGLKKTTSCKQLSIHNQSICDIIKINKAYNLQTGEELIIDDYCK
ncbi:DUF3990 domain-containing protein [Clostridium sp.]|uniref:DUF3990 domain-containing protein n=1 Tax=Clostridium sp. TaxID=1506 RepID=UPI00262CACFE|nr:DUF3990 domain-containing protein [Clostridium sp.]